MRTGSSNTHFFFITPPSGRGLVIPIFFIITPPSGRGLVIPVFYRAVRTGSSNTHFLRGFFLVVTCPRPPVFARPNKYVLQTFGQHKYYLQSVSVDSPKSSFFVCFFFVFLFFFIYKSIAYMTTTHGTVTYTTYRRKKTTYKSITCTSYGTVT